VEDVHSYAGPDLLGLRRACLSPISSFVRWRAFFIIELHSRKVIHVDVTRSPTDAWTAQQLREATPYGQGPKYLIRDRDNKFGLSFARVAATSGIKILKTPYHAPRANAYTGYLEHPFQNSRKKAVWIPLAVKWKRRKRSDVGHHQCSLWSGYSK
jgi:hypothetical protein